MVIAGITFLQTLGAGLGASLKVLGMFGMGLVGRRPACGQGRQTGGPRSQDSQNFSTVHDETPLVEEMNCH
jgi:hypothetical protein